MEDELRLAEQKWFRYELLMCHLPKASLVPYFAINMTHAKSVQTFTRLPAASLHAAVKALISASCAEQGCGSFVVCMSVKVPSGRSCTTAYPAWLPAASLKHELSTKNAKSATIACV